MPHTMTCPRCDAEYVQGVVKCADCDVNLVYTKLLTDEMKETARTDPDHVLDVTENPSEELHLLRIGDLEVLQRLASSLEHKAIPHRIEHNCNPYDEDEDGDDSRFKRRNPWSFVLLVRPEDKEAARAVDTELYQKFSHGPPQEAGSVGDRGICPACEGPLTDSSTTCEDCGLIFDG